MEAMSDTETNGPKGKRRKMQEGFSKVEKARHNWKPISFFRTFVAEVDEIMEERIPSNQRGLKRKGRCWWRCDVSTSALLGCQNTLLNDVISGLPDEILYLIISLLSLKDAATTSILSKRWKNLWRTTHSLHFDVMNMAGYGRSMVDFERLGRRKRLQRRCRFIRWVDQILRVHCGSKLESFVVKYPTTLDCGKRVFRWIQFAAEKQAEKLCIDLGERPTYGSFYGKKGLMVFPHGLFDQAGKRSHLRHLSLSRCLLKLPANFNGFAPLVTLEIKNITIQQTDLDNILAACSKLEWLRLDCLCPKLLKFTSFGNSPLQLKHLNVQGCIHLEKIEIHGAVKLASLEYAGAVEAVSLRNTAPPVRLVFRGTTKPFCRAITYVLGKLAEEITDLRTLQFICFTVEPQAIPRQMAIFSKLKHLSMLVYVRVFGLLELTSAFLKAAPFLYKFELNVTIQSGCRGNAEQDQEQEQEQEQELSWGKCCKHQHLKIVHLVNFDAEPIKLLLAEFLLKNADLKHMRIIRRNGYYTEDGEWLVPKLSDAKPLIKRKKVRELIEGLCPASTKLLIS